MKRLTQAMIGVVIIALAGTTFVAWPKGNEPAGPAQVKQAPTDGLMLGDIAAIADVVKDSWVDDPADAGYFVDDAASIRRSPFSLYETHWQIKFSESLPDGIQPQRMERWLDAGAIGELSSSPLQRIAQIGYSTDIMGRLGITIDSAATAERLEKFKTGNKFAAEPRGEVTWGSTVVAVRALSAIDRPIPEGLQDEVLATINKIDNVANPAAVIETVLPLLELATLLDLPSHPRAKLSDLAQRATNMLATVGVSDTDVSWLGAFYALSSVASVLGLPRLQLSSDRCGAILKGRGYASLPGTEVADTQATFKARELGCQGVVPTIKRPYSRAGWLSAAAVAADETLAATAAGIRLAASINQLNAYADKLTRQISKRWIPLIVDSRQSATARLVAHTRVKEIVRLAGAVDVVVPEPAVSAVEQKSMSPLLTIVNLQFAEASARRAGVHEVIRERTFDASSIDQAAVLALAARIGDHAAFALRASEISAKLRISEGIYGAVQCPGGIPHCDSMKPSAMASALGSWVDQVSVAPLERWRNDGLCRGFVCGDDSDDGMSLRSLAVAVACSVAGCGREFPLPI